MWEWRIYYERDFRTDLPEFLNFNDTTPEIRSDFYYDFKQSQYGLKERLSESENQEAPKLELKIRYDKTDSGIEFWHKVMSKDFDNNRSSHLPMYKIEDTLQAEIEEDHEFSSDIELFLNNMRSDVEITQIKKKRWELDLDFYGDIVSFEYVELEVNDQKFYGFSMECENIDVINEIISEYGLLEYQLTGGYPTLISTINSMLLHNSLARY